MKISKKYKKAGALLGTLTAIIALLCILLPGMLKPVVATIDFPNEHLFVDATYLLKTQETNESVNVTCELYITNIWEKDSGKIKAIAYVIETNDNLAIYKNTIEINEIKAEKTSELLIPLILYNNSYKVEILIFENEKLVLKGIITISAYPIYIWNEITHTIKQEWFLKNSVMDFVQIH
jgi:spore maturation protein SpmB